MMLLLIYYSYSKRKQELEKMTSAATYLDQAAGYLCYLCSFWPKIFSHRAIFISILLLFRIYLSVVTYLAVLSTKYRTVMSES